MSAPPIDLKEEFEHLTKAPITEAIIQLRGRVIKPWDEASTLSALKSELPDYPHSESQRAVQQQLNLAPKGVAGPVVDLGWTGAIFRNESKLNIANFQRDAFTFSRLAPYENWDQFFTEALRLYQIHLDQSGIAQVQRIGLRFVNQFDAPSDTFDLSDFFSEPIPVTQTTLSLTRAHFFHQDTYSLANSPYLATVTRTLQPEATPSIGPKLILDIDVFTNAPSPASSTEISARLQEMRWLKNQIFFNSLTPTAINSFR